VVVFNTVIDNISDISGGSGSGSDIRGGGSGVRSGSIVDIADIGADKSGSSNNGSSNSSSTGSRSDRGREIIDLSDDNNAPTIHITTHTTNTIADSIISTINHNVTNNTNSSSSITSSNTSTTNATNTTNTVPTLHTQSTHFVPTAPIFDTSSSDVYGMRASVFNTNISYTESCVAMSTVEVGDNGAGGGSTSNSIGNNSSSSSGDVVYTSTNNNIINTSTNNLNTNNSANTTTMDDVLTYYHTLSTTPDSDLVDRNIDPAAFKALLLAQTKLANALKEMLRDM